MPVISSTIYKDISTTGGKDARGTHARKTKICDQWLTSAVNDDVALICRLRQWVRRASASTHGFDIPVDDVLRGHAVKYLKAESYPLDLCQ
jgi:hypothetical protein